MSPRALLLLAALPGLASLAPACGDKDEGPDPVAEADADTDADTDADADADTDADTDADLEPTAVQDIRQGNVAEGTEVLVEGLVVNGVSTYGLHVQDPAGGEYAGIYLYAGYSELPEGVAVGDEVSAQGTYSEYDDGYSEGTVSLLYTEDGFIELTTAGLGAPEPVTLAQEDAADQELAEPWENMLVQLDECVVSEVSGGYWTLESGARVHNRLYTFDGGLVAPGAEFESIAGVLWYSYDAFRVSPRDGEDFAGFVEPELTEATVYEVQGGALEEGTPVLVTGVRVTAVGSSLVYVQEPDGGEHSGVYVYLGDGGGTDSGAAVGDEVTVKAILYEPEDGTYLDASTVGLEITAAGAGELTPQLVTTADLADEATLQAWEGVLVQVAAVTVTDEEDDDGNFEVDDAVLVDDWLASFDGGTLETDATFESLTGVLVFRTESYWDDPSWRLAPRDEDDYAGFAEAPPSGADLMSPGDLVVTEINYNPSVSGTCDDGDCEWIEVYNASEVEVDLRRLQLAMVDSSGSVVDETSVDETTLVAPGAYAVIAASDGSSWAYSFTPDVAWDEDFSLSNTRAHAIVASNRDGTLDETGLYSVEAGEGVSWQLLPEALDSTSNDDAGNWCASGEDADEDGDYGTPGAANGECLVLDTGGG